MNITPADWVPGPGQGHWTYDHYASLPDDGHRYEIVNGILIDITATPGIPHQKVVQRLLRYLVPRVLDAGLGELLIAPLDVELSPKTVLQPDVVIVLNAGLDKVTETHVIGAPDLVIEVVTPRTAVYDRTVKREAYALAGVAEYWLVDRTDRTVEVLTLKKNTYLSEGVFREQTSLHSKVIPTIAEVAVEQVFA